LKLLKSSLKSELAGISSFEFVCEDHHLPSRGKYRRVALALPELDIKGAVGVLKRRQSLHDQPAV